MPAYVNRNPRPNPVLAALDRLNGVKRKTTRPDPAEASAKPVVAKKKAPAKKKARKA